MQASSLLDRALLISMMLAGLTTTAFASPIITSFTPDDLIISTVSGTALDSASPIALQEFSLGAGGKSATSVGTFVLPQTPNGANSAISGEYGSASEGILQQSVNGKYLTIMGYGVNANAFNSAPITNYQTPVTGQTTPSLGQTTSVTGGPFITVPRVVALIGGSGSVDTTTALTGVFNTNNPRSAATIDGSSFYVSGQGASKTDPTQGVFLAQRGATTAMAIDNTTDTRVVSIINNGTGNTLYVSRDFNPSASASCGGVNANNCTNISRLSGPGTLPLSSTTPTRIIPSSASVNGGNTGSIDLTSGLANGINNARIGKFVYLSPEQYFFADATTLYVADSGQPKNGNANAAALGEGGLQKWTFNGTSWNLAYDLVNGLSLVNNNNVNLPGNTTTTAGVTGLFGLTGKVVGSQVELFATTYGLNELSPSFLYEITDTLSDTSIAQANADGESFTKLYSAPLGESIRGVAFAPTNETPLPATLPLFASGLGALGLLGWRRKRKNAALAV